MNPELKYVLEHQIDRRQCKLCYAMWFAFDHHGQVAYYRLGQDEPDLCEICKPIDEDIESKCVVSHERWVTIE